MDSDSLGLEEPDYIATQIELFLLINRCRQNPQLLITMLESIIPRFDGKLYKPKSSQEDYITHEGVEVVWEAIERLEVQDPLPPFQLSKGLFLAAKTHCDDIGQNGLASHKGSNGMSLSQRIDYFGKWKDLIAENIAFTDFQCEDIIINFVLDDGNENRGHRENLLNPNLNCIGIACGPHVDHGNCCVINFSTQMFEVPDSDLLSDEYNFIQTQIENYGGSQMINRALLSQTEIEDEKEEEYLKENALNSFKVK